MPLSSFLSRHKLSIHDFEKFLDVIEAESFNLKESMDEHKSFVIDVRHGGERHSYAAHDIRILAARAEC